MAKIRFTDLPIATALDGTEYFPLVQAGTDKRAQLNQLPEIINPDWINVVDYGAVADDPGDGTGTDNSTAFANAYSAAKAAGVPLYIPGAPIAPGGEWYGYRISTTFTLDSCRVGIIGDGSNVSVIYYTGSSVGIKITPPTDESDNNGHMMRGFTIRAVPAATTGVPSTTYDPSSNTIGINVVSRVTLGYYAYFNWFDVWSFGFELGAFFDGTANGNLAVDPPGGQFFTGRIEKCLFKNGFWAAYFGDTIAFIDNVVYGDGYLRIWMNNGSRGVIVARCNLTMTQGMDLSACSGLRFEENHFEINGDYNGNFDSAISIYTCTDLSFHKSRISQLGTVKGNYLVTIAGTSNTGWFDQPSARITFDECEWQGAPLAHIAASTNINTQNHITVTRYNYTQDPAFVVTLASADQNIWEQPASCTFASLASASAAGTGARGFITNATTNTFYSVAAGGGAFTVPVVSDGTNWRIG